MAIIEALKSFSSGLGDEVGALLGRVNYKSNGNPLGVNFRRFGPSFGTYDFDAFIEYAKRFYREGLHSNDSLYTVVEMDGRTAIDYNGEIRGIYTERGRPLAFFRPDYRAAGYRSKSEELEGFKNGKDVAWY